MGRGLRGGEGERASLDCGKETEGYCGGGNLQLLLSVGRSVGMFIVLGNRRSAAAVALSLE